MYKIGDIIEGEVTGIQNYGIFVKLSDDTQGLVHISECRHGYVGGLTEIAKVGDKLKVKVIDIDEYTKTISLSIRALKALNVPPFPARIKRKRKYRPNIGFKTLAKKLPEWIDNALQDIEENRFNLKNKNKDKD